MKKKLLFTVLFSVILCSASFAQLSIQNASFETPADNWKIKADGTADGGAFNNIVPGWWADPAATDCGRQNSGKPAADGTYPAYAYNLDGSVWAKAGIVEAGKLSLAVSFYSRKSYIPATVTGPFNLILKFAVYDGTEPSITNVIETQTKVCSDIENYTKYDYTYVLPETAVGKNLLIGFDIETPGVTEGVWFLFDNFNLTVSPSTGIKKNLTNNALRVFPNPATDFITIQVENNLENKYSFYNTVGKEVLSGIVYHNALIDVQMLDKGVYFLKVENSVESRMMKTIIK